MKNKTLKIIYWGLLILLCIVNLMSGISGFFPNEQSVAIMALLQYPMYLLIIIGIAKILGVVAMLQTKYVTIKEWAYAGFAIDYVGASASFAFVGAGLLEIAMPLVFLIVLLLVHYLWIVTSNRKSHV